MSREIKFRAWDARCEGEEGYVSELTMMQWPISVLTSRYLKGVTFEQFTGLHDTTGKEIYEGDLLLNNFFGDVWEVCFEDGAFVVKLLEKYDPKRQTEYLGGLVDFEVVGNIHSNPWSHSTSRSGFGRATQNDHRPRAVWRSGVCNAKT